MKKNNEYPQGVSILPQNYGITSFEEKSVTNLVVLNGVIEECTPLISDIMKLNPNDALSLIINSPGGCLNSTICLYNLLKDFPYLATIVNGCAYSGGGILLMSSENRFITEYSEIMIHNASTTEYGNISSINNSVGNLRKRMERLITELFKKYLTKKELVSILEEGKDLYLDCDEVIKRGIAQPYRIIEPKNKKSLDKKK